MPQSLHAAACWLVGLGPRSRRRWKDLHTQHAMDRGRAHSRIVLTAEECLLLAPLLKVGTHLLPQLALQARKPARKPCGGHGTQGWAGRLRTPALGP